MSITIDILLKVVLNLSKYQKQIKISILKCTPGKSLLQYLANNKALLVQKLWGEKKWQNLCSAILRQIKDFDIDHLIFVIVSFTPAWLIFLNV